MNTKRNSYINRPKKWILKKSNMEEEKVKNRLHRECNSMSVYRSLELPEELKTDNFDAEFIDGILHLSLPKVKPKPELKPTKIKIK